MDSTTSARQILFALLAILLSSTALAGLRPAPQAITTLAADTDIDRTERLYIVQLDNLPALAVPGVQGERAIASGFLAGSIEQAEFDPDSARVRSHMRRLQRQQDGVLEALGLSDKRVYSYGYTFNGMAVQMTPAQAERMRLVRGVASVWEDRRRSVSTDSSSEFLGLLDTDEGLRTAGGLDGDGVIIGVIDSGITPQHPSFSDRAVRDKPRICRSEWAENSLLGKFLCRRFNRPGSVIFADTPAGWRGACETGPNFTTDDCNNKLIGARFYNRGFTQIDRFPIDPNEFLSPADADGHGSHIASIAAGNFVEADIFGRRIGRISGVAPRARVAVYKACWLEPGGFRATCSVADLQAAIEDAVADGVDIINYSVGSLDDSLTDPDDLALLTAADAGILSVVATGNDGPEAFTMQAPATTPWVLSVGASTRSGRRVAEALRVEEPEAVAGLKESREASFTPELSSNGPITAELVLIDDGQATTPEGEIGTVVDGCSAFVNGDDVTNNIAYIQRGGCDFRDKVLFAQDAGAVAVIVFNNDDNLVVMAGDSSSVTIPAVMIGQADGQLLRDRLAADEQVRVTLDKSLFVDFTETGNIMGSFSGRGPNLAEPDFLKPDVTAPGVNILGAQTPDVANGFRGEWYQYLSGTSQSAPQVAGIAALIKQQHPDWTPAEIKSALMTTARQNILKEADGAAADPFDMGAGHIVPNTAVDPGLVYATETAEYDSYLCNVGLARLTPAECAALAVSFGGLDLDARDINLPSIAVTELVASVDVVRTVRAVSGGVYNVEVEAPTGVDVSVSPASLNLGPGDEADYTVTFSTSNAALNQWLFGAVSWVSENHTVRSPFAVQPTQVTFTDGILGTGAAGTGSIGIQFGYDGEYAAVLTGLEKPCVLPDNNLSDNVCSNIQPQIIDNDRNQFYQFFDSTLLPVPGVRRFVLERTGDLNDLYVRFALFDELTDYEDDLDLYVWDCEGERTDPNDPNSAFVCDSVRLVGASQNVDSSTEIVDDPDALSRDRGAYLVDVHGFRAGNGIVSISRFCLLAWSLGPADAAGNLTETGAPTTAVSGTGANFDVNWAGLDDGLWLGGVEHRQGNTSIGLSLVDVNNNGLVEQDPAAFICPN